MGKATTTYKIYLDVNEGMRHAFLTIDCNALDEIGCLEELLDAELPRYECLTRLKTVFSLDGTIRVTFADGTEKEFSGPLTICFSDEYKPGIVVKHKGKKFLICVDADDMEELDPDDDDSDDSDDSEDDDDSDDSEDADDDDSDDSEDEHTAVHDLGDSKGGSMRCPMCEGATHCKEFVTEDGWTVHSTGCKPCGLYGAPADSAENAASNFRQLSTQLVRWKHKDAPSNKAVTAVPAGRTAAL